MQPALTFQPRQDEIASLEAQMVSASTYAAAGLKRRLQTLKAVDGKGCSPGGHAWRQGRWWGFSLVGYPLLKVGFLFGAQVVATESKAL